jgi:hypothetical protein
MNGRLLQTRLKNCPTSYARPEKQNFSRNHANNDKKPARMHFRAGFALPAKLPCDGGLADNGVRSRKHATIGRNTEMTFTVLEGKKIAGAIKGFGKKCATFSGLVHQIAYSAINHVEAHHDAIYCNAFYNALPVNYRKMVADYMTAFGKVTFDSKDLTLTYAKSKKSDLESALTVSPADFQKTKKAGGEKVDTVEKALASFLTRLEAIKDKSGLDPRVIAAAKAIANIGKEESNVVEMPAPKAKTVRKPKAAAAA